MLAIHGYYDGLSFQPLEKPQVKTNQRVIITIMDDFMETPKAACKDRSARAKKVRGILAEYADPELQKQENGAWERAAVEKYGNI